MKTLLVHPPFAAPFSPYISVAALAAHMKSQGLPVAVLDANNLLLRALLAPESLRAAREQATQRLRELNAAPRLRFAEAAEFCMLADALATAKTHFEAYLHAADRETPMHPQVRMVMVSRALQLVSRVHFPEFLDVSGSMVHFVSPYSDYSTRDVLQAAESLTIVQPHLGRIMRDALTSERPGVAGLSVSFPDQMGPAMHCARLIKEISPETLVVMGGSFISCHARSTRDTGLFRWVDAFVLDDGEQALEAMARRRAAGPLGPAEYAAIPGAMYVEDGVIRRTPSAQPLEFAETPPPDYAAFDLDAYFIPRQAIMLPLRLSRGCNWGRCSFCRTELSMIHHYSEGVGEAVFRKVRETAEACGVDSFIFSDDSASPVELEAFSRLALEHKRAWRWVTSIRFDPRITMARASLYREAGCRMLTLGLEAYNDRLLKLVRKGTTVELIDRVLSNFAWGGMPVSAYMILGLPTETLEEAQASHAALRAKREAGQLELLIYSPFQVVQHSDIGTNPAAYGVSAMTFPPELDLDPPIFDFESTGMSRETMLAFAMENNLFFSALLAKSASQFSQFSADAGNLETLGTLLNAPLRYDPGRLNECIQAHSRNTVTYGRWLASTTAAAPPITPDIPSPA